MRVKGFGFLNNDVLRLNVAMDDVIFVKISESYYRNSSGVVTGNKVVTVERSFTDKGHLPIFKVRV